MFSTQIKLIKPVAEDVWWGQGCCPQDDIILEDIWYIYTEEPKLQEKYKKIIEEDTFYPYRKLGFQTKYISIKLHDMKSFLTEYKNYENCKISLKNKKEDNTFWKREEEIVKKFEEKYFTETF